MALPDVGTIVAELNRSVGGLDTALRQSYTTPGRLTWDWSGPGGDLLFDDSAAFPVLSRILARKGRYRSDRSYGTLLGTLKKDRRATGSQLAAYVRDGGAQVEAEEKAQNVTSRPQRITTGRWKLPISWTRAGQVVTRVLGF